MLAISRPPSFAWAALLGWLLMASYAPAQEIIYSRQATFRIPFQTDAGEKRIQQVQLYVSEDQGRTWKQNASAAPTENKGFTFSTNRDGLYWFAVRTIDWENKAYPATMDQAQPGLRVVVDTTPPVIDLKPLPARDSSVGVEWNVRDDNLDLNALVLEYRVGATGAWQELSIERLASSRKIWNPATNATLQVRMRARDKAENSNEAATTVAAGSNVAGTVEQPRPTGPVAGGPLAKMVNSKRISLNYEIKEVGPSDVSTVELWILGQDGRSWRRHSEDTAHRPPYVVDVEGEGLYGFTLVARSGVGLGEQPPKAGDPPQVWVEVDLTKPAVQLRGVEVGRGADSGNLTITWSAGDKNLEVRPVTLSYAERAEGPWTPISAGLDNTGQYVWHMPAGVPFRFLIRVEAVDRAGNVGSASTDPAKPVIVDLSQPKVQVLSVESATK